VPKAGPPPGTLGSMPGLQTRSEAEQAAQTHMTGAMGRAAAEGGRLLGEAGRQTLEDFAAPVMGAVRPLVGAGQLLSHGAEAIGIPGADKVAQAADTTASGLEGAIDALPPELRVAAAAGDIGASLAAPGGAIASLPRLARPVASAALGAASGAAQPVAAPDVGAPIPDYWSQKGEQTAVGAATGFGLQTIGEGVNAVRNAMTRYVSPKTVTNAAARILGVNADKLTPQVLNQVRRRIGAELDRIENSYDVTIDKQLIGDLGDVDQKARDLLGDQAGSIVRAIDSILSRAQKSTTVPGGGSIPGKAAATLWHKGSSLDNMTESRNPDIASLAQQAQNAVRQALNRQLPPSEALAYSAARSQWRDLKIVEKSLEPDQTVSPRQLVRQTNKRFPNSAYIPDASAPAMLRLGRAVGETFTPRGSLAPHLVASALGGFGGHLAGGPIGAVAGTLSGNLLIDRLLRLRYASPNAMRMLRPSRPANSILTLGQFAAPAAAGPALMAPSY